jgi:Holliday junction resolvase RusA-like endonuclease
VYVGKSPRIADTPKAAEFKEEAVLHLREQRQAVRWDTLEGIRSALGNGVYTPLKMDICYFFPTMWRRDVDGGDKAVIDAVFKFLQLNDNLITCLHATKQADKQNPRVEFQVSLAQE